MFFQFFFRKHYDSTDTHDGLDPHRRVQNLVIYPERDWGDKPKEVIPPKEKEAPTPPKKQQVIPPSAPKGVLPTLSTVQNSILEIKKEMRALSEGLSEDIRRQHLNSQLKVLQEEEEILFLLIISD